MYTFKSGKTIETNPISAFQIGKVQSGARRLFIREHGEPVVPTYTITLPGGEEETHDHNADSIAEHPYRDDEELQQKWMDYVTLDARLRSHVTNETAKAVCWYGIADSVPDEWIEEQEQWGIELPESKFDLKYEWVQSFCKNWDELLNLVIAIQSDNPVEEAARAAEESFQPEMETQGRDDAGADKEAPK